MAKHTTTWEDDDCSRLVQLLVDYQMVDSRVEIEQVTPIKVQFLNSDGTAGRQIGVWTEKGRHLLRTQHDQRFGEAALTKKIESELAP